MDFVKTGIPISPWEWSFYVNWRGWAR